MAEAEPPRVTALLVRWRGGDDAAGHELLPLVHQELQRIARRHMAGERRGHVLQTTALVNEAYIRLVDARRVQWRDRAHFFAMTARVMRRVLVDVALDRFAAQHGRQACVVELRFFGGLSLEEAAEVPGISEETVHRDWRFAKTWLFRELSASGAAS